MKEVKIVKKTTRKKLGANHDKHKRKQKVIAQYKLHSKQTKKNVSLGSKNKLEDKKDMKDKKDVTENQVAIEKIKTVENDMGKLNMKGGQPKEEFQVMTLDDIDYNQFKLSKKIKINWGKFPDGPPTDCTIL